MAQSGFLDAASLLDVRGKICLVTGGSRGIGLMLAEALAINGAKVYISSRKARCCSRLPLASALDLHRPLLTRLRRSNCEEQSARLSGLAAAARNGGECHSLPADLGRDGGCDALFKALSARESRLHVLVNNAGATWGEPIVRSSHALLFSHVPYSSESHQIC